MTKSFNAQEGEYKIKKWETVSTASNKRIASTISLDSHFLKKMWIIFVLPRALCIRNQFVSKSNAYMVKNILAAYN